jgi:hypothetical protein
MAQIGEPQRIERWEPIERPSYIPTPEQTPEVGPEVPEQEPVHD